MTQQKELSIAYRNDVRPLRNDFVRNRTSCSFWSHCTESIRCNQFSGYFRICRQLYRLFLHGYPIRYVTPKIGYKKTALIAILVGFTGVGVQALASQAGPDYGFTVYLSGAFISGFSMCMLNAVVNPMLNTLGGGGKKVIS